MILKKLFTSLHQAGVVIVSTSNRHPTELYKHGLQRDLFLPFIEYLLSDFIVHSMDSTSDYRTFASPSSLFKCYYQPVSDDTYQAFHESFVSLSKHPRHVFPEMLQVFGRSLRVNAVEESPSGDRIALFRFDELCAQALGPADFIILAETYRGVFISHVPVMTLSERSEVTTCYYIDPLITDQLRRFITLIDCLYEKGVLLIIQADAAPQQLLKTSAEDKAQSIHDEVFNSYSLITSCASRSLGFRF